MQPASRTFHCTKAGSSKFWTISSAADGKSFTVTFGKISTAGQSKEKTFPTVEACTREAEKLIHEKTSKGYIEQSGATAAPVAQADKSNSELDHALLDTCKVADLENTNAIMRLLKHGANPNTRDADGLTPLHHIATQDYSLIIEEGLRILCDAGADPRALDNASRTPLFHFHTGYADGTVAARKLVEAGIDPAHKDAHGNNALAHMLNRRFPEDEEDNHGDHEFRVTTATFLHAGVPATDCDSDGNTALHLIVTKQELGGEAEKLIKLAIEKGAAVNARNKAGYTPLHAAVMRPKDDRHIVFDYLIKELLRNKADINAQDPKGNTAIHLCADPDKDFFILIGGNPDLNIANAAGVTVLQHIKNLGYYDEKKHAPLKKNIDDLIAEPASARNLPPLIWQSAPINLSADCNSTFRTPHFELKIASSFHIQTNNASDDFVHIGANRLAIAGNIPSDITAFDTVTGKILWTVKGSGNIAYDGHAVYIAREHIGSRFVTAHDPDTGAEIWHCGMSSSYKQFGTRFVCTPNYVVHASQSANKFYPVHKKTGKKYIAPLKNPYPLRRAGDPRYWGGVCHDDPHWLPESLIPYGDTLLVLGVKPKQHVVAIDQYDLAAKGVHIRTIFELQEDVQPTGHHYVRGDFLYLFTNHGEILKIEIPTGDTHSIVTPQDTDCDENVQYTYTCRDLVIAGDKMHYLLRRKCDHLYILNTYDIQTDTVTASHRLPEGPPLDKHLVANSENLVYCFGHGGGTGREIIIYDMAKREKVSSLTLPNYGGYDWVEQRLILGDAIYVLQKGGLENNEDTTVLHRIQ